MKIIIFALFITVILVLGFFVFKYGNIGESKVEENWKTNNSDISGIWGTTIEVEYIDGSITTLNDAFALDISFKDKHVAYFRYILYSKVDSEIYDIVNLDFSEFFVSASVSDLLTGLGSIVKEDDVSISVDDDWIEVYMVVVDEEELKSLALDTTFNLSFMPSGVIKYSGSSSTVWKDVPSPSFYWLNFDVRDFTTIPDVPDDPTQPPGDGDTGMESEIYVVVSD